MHSEGRNTRIVFRHLLRRAAHPEGTTSFCFLWYFLVHTIYTLRSSCLSWGSVQGVSWGAYRESPFYFPSLPFYVEGTSLTTSLRYQDAVLAEHLTFIDDT
jgi:hypothetical protein